MKATTFSVSPDLVTWPLIIDGWSLSTWPWHHSLPLVKPLVIRRQSHHSRHSGCHEAPNDKSLSRLQKENSNGKKKHGPCLENLMIMHISCRIQYMAFKFQLSWSYNHCFITSGICNAKVPQKEIKSKQIPRKPKISTSKGDCNLSFSRGCSKSSGCLRKKRANVLLLDERHWIFKPASTSITQYLQEETHIQNTFEKNMIFSSPYWTPAFCHDNIW